METRPIYITGQDMLRLRQLLIAAEGVTTRDLDHLATLSHELDRAILVTAEDAPSDIVTMRSQVRVRDLESGETSDYTLGYPWEADVASNHVSVLAPLGTALLGYREGDQFTWRMPGGVRRLCVEKILHQPEATRRQARVARNAADEDVVLHA